MNTAPAPRELQVVPERQFESIPKRFYFDEVQNISSICLSSLSVAMHLASGAPRGKLLYLFLLSPPSRFCFCFWVWFWFGLFVFAILNAFLQ